MPENKIVVALKGIITLNGNILIIKRAGSDQVGAGTWEFPGGKLEFGETLEQALMREVKEEVGIDITVEKIAYASSFLTDPARQVIIIAYHCRTEHEKITLSEEHTDYLWASKGELARYLPSSIVEDLEKK
jgi:8-oxo-dGTP diphosphatase